MTKDTWVVLLIVIIGAIPLVYIYLEAEPIALAELHDFESYDITGADVIDLIDKNLITSEQVSVKGLKLGDNLLEIFRVFGTESYLEEFPKEKITNVRYWNEDNQTTVIFHLVDNKIQRMAIKKGMRDQLIGKTGESLELKEITSMFGKPDKSEDTTTFRIYTYKDKGLEIYHKRKKMFGFGLIPPS